MIALRKCIESVLLASFFWMHLINCSAQERPSRPNILWITCEDISPNLGCYGDPYAVTPYLDQLANDGVLYTNAFASAPVCAVARSSIITGLYASSQGTQHMRCAGRIPAGIRLYPEYLKEAGYYCTNNVKTDYNLEMDPKSIWDQCSGDAHWRNRSNPDQPFFSIFNLTTSHESRVNERARYVDAIKNIPRKLLKNPGDVPLPPYYPDVDSTRELWSRYYNIITAMDLEVGEILKQLEEDRLLDKTIVIFYSDHGAGIPRHKRWLYDTGIRVPWIVRIPDGYIDMLPHPQGTKTDELVSFVDLAPTALHLAGLPIPGYMPGRAFLGMGLSPERAFIYAGRDRMDERYDMQRCVRDKRYKYIRYYEPYKSFCQYMNTPEKGGIMQAIRAAQHNGTLSKSGKKMVALTKPGEELFDCWDDPLELNNLAEDPAFSEILVKMREVHAKWSDDTKDTGLIPETILRNWEREKNSSIYDLMRTEKIPLREIRETALAQKEFSQIVLNMTHQNEAVRYWAAITLGNQIDKISDFSPLLSGLKDEDPVVRFAASRALSKAGQSERAIPVLVEGLTHQDEWVRLNAALILDEMGPLAKPALDALEGRMGDSNKYVVRVVNHALNGLLNRKMEVP